MKYHIITLGCPKNIVDSEGMGSILDTRGHTPVEQVEDADVVIVNTCSFIAEARAEAMDVLRDMGQHKQPGQRLIVAGCMAQSHSTLIDNIAGVDAVVSTRQWMHIDTLLETNDSVTPADPWQPSVVSTKYVDAQALLGDTEKSYADWRTTSFPRHAHGPTAYLKISDGCNLRCSFCAIPAIKGDMRSKPPATVINEAQQLVAQGIGEIVLVAQHLTDYGRDLGLQDGLAMLLADMCSLLPATVWIRLMYAYPTSITPRLIETMAYYPQICAYLDMPLQHAHPDTLQRMRRPTDTEHIKCIIAHLRDAMPDIALRSTFIVGFPGETKTEFEALLRFLDEVQFDWVGVFHYSHEFGTHAATLSNQVKPQTIERRWHMLMQHQQPLSLACNAVWQGRELDVLVEGEGMTDDNRHVVVGRSFREAPGIDGQVFVWGTAAIGSVIRVHITDATPYDLWGEVS